MSKRKKMLTAEEIKAAARQIPEDESKPVIDGLQARLEGRPETVDDWEDEWAAELERRIAKVDSGEVTPIPIDEAIARWESLLR
ncbi:addiction module protein [Longimicrobium sp.]|jgi:putative addiction module component (TIGR02574 family)|uniref:addiction module protein n=1 Tax=Longimicrobium sp. TaxID=2029185 RepID=UPI002F95049C